MRPGLKQKEKEYTKKESQIGVIATTSERMKTIGPSTIDRFCLNRVTMLAFLLVYPPGSGVVGRGEGKKSEELVPLAT